jgi:hypothetical protein
MGVVCQFESRRQCPAGSVTAGGEEMGYRKSEERVSRSVGLLISVLVRYPEVGTVRYDPRKQTIRWSVLLTGTLGATEFEQLRTLLVDTLEVYHLLSQRRSAVLEVSQDAYGDLTAINLSRDTKTLSPEEIYMVSELFRERFSGRLVVETVEYAGEDELMAQDEMIQDMLVDLESSRGGRNLIAIREDGRVMVFQA